MLESIWRLSAKTTVKGQNFGYNYEISRGLFESLIEPYFSKIEMLIEEVIDESKLSFSKIDNIILVGGSSRIPLVTSLIKRLFKKEPIKLGNMDEAVALGAAIHGGIKVASSNENRHLLTPKAIKELSSIRLKDVANHSYGTLAIKFNEEQQKDEQAYFIIIPKNTKLPVQETKRFYTRIENQLEVDISVYQGEDLESPESNRKIYDGVMKVPGNRPKGQPFDITYIYDENQMMKCIFLDVNSGKKEEIDLSLNKQDDDINNSEIDEYLDF
jgi:molecular chaperone DnaK (HSP70)